jgi:head-tail adaptor
MISGLLNQRIEIYTNTITRRADGGTEPNNELYWATNAKVKQLRSSRNQEANQVQMSQIFSFEIRYRRDKNIQNDMLLYWRGTWLIIQGYMPDVVYNDWVKFDAVANNTGNLVTT